jgi:hypothetical protein
MPILAPTVTLRPSGSLIGASMASTTRRPNAVGSSAGLPAHLAPVLARVPDATVAGLGQGGAPGQLTVQWPQMGGGVDRASGGQHDPDEPVPLLAG